MVFGKLKTMTKFVKGNEAVVMGALYAGCELYFGYPITPASEIAHGAAKWFPMLGRTFVQAECETASVNMMFGAAAAGKLCMTATSGPGFSLMQEGLSYLAGAELPGAADTATIGRSPLRRRARRRCATLRCWPSA